MFHILLDAEVFHRESLYFGSKRLGRLIELVDADEVTVYVTDVIVGEIHSAIANSVRNAALHLRQNATRRIVGILAQSAIANIPGVLSRLDEAAITAELVGSFQELLKDLGAVEITTDKVSVAELRRRYFNSVPPFGGVGIKKYEFPDALSVLAGDAYAVKHGFDLHIVSADADIAAAAKLAKRLKHVDTLESITAQVLESAQATAALAEAADELSVTLSDKIAVRVEDSFLHSGFHVENDWGEVTEVAVVDVSVLDPTVVAIENDVVTLEFTANVKFHAEVSINDPDQTAYDSETGETIVFGHLERRVWDTAYLHGESTVRIDLADPSNSQILSVSISPSDIGVTFPSTPE